MQFNMIDYYERVEPEINALDLEDCSNCLHVETIPPSTYRKLNKIT